MIAAHIKAGVIGIVRVAGTGEVDPANDGIAGVQHHDRASVSRVDCHLAAAIDGQLLVDGDRARIIAGRWFEYRTWFGTVNHILKGL